MGDKPIGFKRHETLAAAVRSHLQDGGDFHYQLASFLDGFYLAGSREDRRAGVADPPPLKQDPVFDATIGAIGEHLSRRWRLGPAPAWTEQPERFLHRPHFLGPERMKPILLVESPSAYRRRFLFTEMEPLRRARMPRDAAWWEYEKLRTGMEPLPEDIMDEFGRPLVAAD